MSSLYRILLITGYGLLLSVGPLPAGAEYYQWIDKEGNVHYSDHIPVEDTDYGQRVIDEKGQTVGVIEGKKAPEEIKAERIERERREAERRELEKQQAHDRALLATFQSITDLEAARDERIGLIDQGIKLATNTLQKHQKQLDELDQKRVQYTAQGKEPPGWIITNSQRLQEQIDISKAYMREKRLERVKIADRFNRDIERFIQLTAHSSTPD